MKPYKFELPTVFVIFGITGDLMRTKLLKSLYLLHLKGLLPKKFQVLGFSRRGYDDEQLRAYLKEVMEKGNYAEKDKYEQFLASFYYVQGDFADKEAYKKLAITLGRVDDIWRICSNKLFYLAVPPLNYRSIIDNLHESGLTIPCSPEEGWTRVILEKPFGTDLKTAQDLDRRLGELFKEEQIYRVDHYLGKETVRNILAFRFSNSLLTPAWNKKEIEKIEIKKLETNTVSTRGEFYDQVGALRDVGQNHMLQMLALFIMDNPGSLTPENIRRSRAEALASLKVFTSEEVSAYTMRGQYENYREEKGVNKKSATETYFKIKTFTNCSDFEGIPIYLEGGKALAENKTEIVITFKHQKPCLCPPNHHSQNVLRYVILPDEKILLSFLVKKPGYEFTITQTDFELDYKKVYHESQFIEDYEQLLMDIIKGDQTLFVTTEEIFSEWQFVEPILQYWKENKEVTSYPAGIAFSPAILNDVQIPLQKKLGIVGLGKMGGNLAIQMLEKGWNVVGYNRTLEKTQSFEQYGLVTTKSLRELVQKLQSPRIIWLMLPAGDVTDEAIFGANGVIHYLQKGDIVIDAANSFYKDSIRRGRLLEEKGIQFVDVGFSGGPGGARNGACLMVGGSEKLYKQLLPLYLDISTTGGVQHFLGIGAGHFVKMVHNGIEYGMMQAIAEGFNILKHANYSLDLTEVADVYNHGSVIESRLIEWLQNAFSLYGQELKDVSGTVKHTGEGAWTVNTAKEMGLKAKVIEDALQFRVDSEKKPDYTGKVVSAIRNQFGGHAIK